MDIAAMNYETIRAGLTVRTAATLEPWTGMGAGGPNTRQRRPNALGVVVNRSTGILGTWYVQHEGDACLTLYREKELTTAMEPAAPEPQATQIPPDVPAIERLFQAVVERRNALEEALGQLIAALPEEGPWSMLRAQAEVEKASAGHVADVEGWRAMIAEIQRPKGPMIRVEGRRARAPWRLLGSFEFIRRTDTTIFLRDDSGERYSVVDGTVPRRDMRIHPDDLTLAQTTDWAPTKPAKSAKKKH